jgi:hypothetical protein
LWRQYGHPAFPRLDGILCPGAVRSLAGPFPCQDGISRYLPVSAALLQSHRAAFRSALAFVANALPRARLFDGRFLFLGCETPAETLTEQTKSGNLAEIALRELPPWARPYVISPLDLTQDAPDRLEALARHCISRPLTCIAGTVEQLKCFFGRVRQITGRDRIAEVWPGLTAVLSQGSTAEHRAALRDELGSARVLLLETYFPPEGAVAVEDPRCGLLRLLPDHGVYFEFVPVAELGSTRPTRHGVGKVEPGVPYALTLTSPSGLWAAHIGDTVCFEQSHPPLFRLLEPAIRQTERATDGAPLNARPHPFPPQPPHSRIGAFPTSPVAQTSQS